MEGGEPINVVAETAALIEWQHNLATVSFDVKSPTDRGYNCLAWAAGDNKRIWSAVPLGPGGQQLAPYYWPGGAPRLQTVPATEAAYGTRGYERCADGEHELLWEKIAIYSDDQGVTHAARQTADGRWASKMGGFADIEHDRLEDIESNLLGKARAFMRRRVRRAALPPGPKRLELPPGVRR
jgi:hypothetical protein